jgi:hypothetical protein
MRGTINRRQPKSDYAVWALLFMSRESEREVENFFVAKLGLSKKFVQRGMHITAYHSRRKLHELTPYTEHTEIAIEPQYWRFMALAPGGENPRPDVDVSKKGIGVRVQRKAPAYKQILELRSRFYSLEAGVLAEDRTPSSERKSAFGARHYQPHVALLGARSGIDSDLGKIGDLFRANIPLLKFDRFVVKCLRSSMIAE